MVGLSVLGLSTLGFLDELLAFVEAHFTEDGHLERLGGAYVLFQVLFWSGGSAATGILMLRWEAPAARPPRRGKGALLLAGGAALACLGFSLWVAPRSAFIEDGPVENLEVAAFAVAAVLLAYASLWQRTDLATGSRLILGAVSLLAFFIAGEELSWGQRLLGWSAPAWQERNLQHETNLHNLFAHGWLLRYLPFAGFAVVWWSALASLFERPRAPFLPDMDLVLPAATVLAALYVVEAHRAPLEVAELQIACCFVVYAFGQLRHRGSPGGRRPGHS